MPEPSTPSAVLGSPAWRGGLTALTAAVGTDAFAPALFRALNAVVQVDSCAVFTFRMHDGPGHLFTVGRIDDATADALACDWVGRYHALDPNFGRLARPAGGDDGDVVPFAAEKLPAPYRRRFFLASNLVDKVSWITRADDRAIYCNFYRRGGSGAYGRREHDLLAAVVPIVGHLIGAHSLLARAFAPRDAADEIDRLAALAATPLAPLTARERDVCVRILLGYGSEAIGLDLGIAPSSVVTYRKRAYEKLGICSQAELFTRCLRALRVFAT